MIRYELGRLLREQTASEVHHLLLTELSLLTLSILDTSNSIDDAGVLASNGFHDVRGVGDNCSTATGSGLALALTRLDHLRWDLLRPVFERAIILLGADR